MEDLKTKKPAWNEGWYWSSGDDSPCYGPSDTREEAEQEFWHDGAGEDAYKYMAEDTPPEDMPTKEEFLRDYAYISHMSAGPISCEAFDADCVLETLEDHNEENVWHDCPPEWPKDAKPELEAMLADALYRWLDKHDLWKEFRGLT